MLGEERGDSVAAVAVLKAGRFCFLQTALVEKGASLESLLILEGATFGSSERLEADRQT